MAQTPTTSTISKAPRKKAATPVATDADTMGTAAATAKPAPNKPKTTASKVKETASNFVSEATNAARHAANEGKDRATEALDTFSKVVDNAAEMVEENVGETYGAYARRAAAGVSDFSKTLQGKDVDALIEDTRNFVRRSPIVAIGAAAAVGFVLIRLAKLGSGGTNDA